MCSRGWQHHHRIVAPGSAVDVTDHWRRRNHRNQCSLIYLDRVFGFPITCGDGSGQVFQLRDGSGRTRLSFLAISLLTMKFTPQSQGLHPSRNAWLHTGRNVTLLITPRKRH